MNKLINRNQVKLERLLALEPRILKSKLIQLPYSKWNSIPRDIQEQLFNHAYSEN